jgi:hypothetical protein
VCDVITYGNIRDFIIGRAIDVTSTEARVHVDNIFEDLGLWMSCRLNNAITTTKEKSTHSFKDQLSAEKKRRRAVKAVKAVKPAKAAVSGSYADTSGAQSRHTLKAATTDIFVPQSREGQGSNKISHHGVMPLHGQEI